MEERAIQIGSQLFINKKDTPQRVREWVKLMKDTNMLVIRLFMVWDQIEPKENQWDFRNYDACFEEAELQNMMVIPTLMSVSPPGWMKLTGGMQDVANLNDAKFWSLANLYVKKVVERYYKSPVFDTWILWNEPYRKITLDKYTIKAYQDFLKTSYKNDIDSLNIDHYMQYKSFDEIGNMQGESINSLQFKGNVEQIDWAHFSVYNLCEKLRDIKNTIREIDTVHEIHVNPHALAGNIMDLGQSIWEEAKEVDFIGCSAHPSWHSTRFLQDRLHQSVAYFADLMKSATLHKNGKFLVTELQGGTNIFSGGTYLCPSENDITQWMWESIGSGASGVIFWCFNTRNSGFEAGEWGLLNQCGKPSQRLKAASKVAATIQKYSALFGRSKPLKADVWILYSESSCILGQIQGIDNDVSNPRNQEMAMDAIVGAYLMCADMGLNVSFINEERLNAGKLENNNILIVPGATSLKHKTCESINYLVQNGGTVIADGLIGMMDEKGYVSEENKDIMDNLFGATLEDITSDSKQFTLDISETKLINGWFLKCFFNIKGANTIGRFSNGSPGIVNNKYGSGVAVRIGTIFFQRYLSEPQNDHIKFLKDIFNSKNIKKVKHENPSFNLRMKILETEKSDIVILLNNGVKRNITLSFSTEGILKTLEDEVVIEFKNRDIVEIELTEKEVRVLKAEYENKA